MWNQFPVKEKLKISFELIGNWVADSIGWLENQHDCRLKCQMPTSTQLNFASRSNKSWIMTGQVTLEKIMTISTTCIHTDTSINLTRVIHIWSSALDRFKTISKEHPSSSSSKPLNFKHPLISWIRNQPTCAAFASVHSLLLWLFAHRPAKPLRQKYFGHSIVNTKERWNCLYIWM